MCKAYCPETSSSSSWSLCRDKVASERRMIPMHRDEALKWIEGQGAEMANLVRTWAQINSESGNIAGLATMRQMLEREFASLGGEMRVIDLSPVESIDSAGKSIKSPLGKAISIVKRPNSPRRVFLG